MNWASFPHGTVTSAGINILNRVFGQTNQIMKQRPSVFSLFKYPSINYDRNNLKFQKYNFGQKLKKKNGTEKYTIVVRA